MDSKQIIPSPTPYDPLNVPKRDANVTDMPVKVKPAEAPEGYERGYKTIKKLGRT